MVNYLLAALGIGVSVALFLVGYRQTIGARKERIVNANSDLGRVLLRRVVLESFSPEREDIDRLRDGKAREHRVGSSDILLPVELMNTVYTQVIENDFISAALRKEIIERIDPLLEKLNKAEEQEPELPAEKGVVSSALPVLFGIFASAVGAVVAILPQFRYIALGRKQAIELIVITGSVSFGIIATYLLFNRLREEQQESPPRTSVLKTAYEFEKSVLSAIRKTGLSVVRAPVQSGYDFEVSTKTGAKILVEVKAWSWRVPTAMIRDIIVRLNHLVAKEKAKEALLVVREPVKLPIEALAGAPVRVLTLAEIRNYLAHWTPS